VGKILNYLNNSIYKFII